MTRVVMTGAGDYNGPSQPRAQLAPFQGFTYGDITAIEEGTSRTGNVTLDMTITLREPGAEGINVRKVQPISGEMSGKRAGVPNIVGLYDIYFSAFTAAVSEDEAKKLVREVQDQEMDSTDIIDELKGKRVWFKLKAETATNRESGEQYLVSGVDAFTARQVFEANSESGSHHWANPPPPSQAAGDRPNGVGGMGSGQSRAAGRI